VGTRVIPATLDQRIAQALAGDPQLVALARSTPAELDAYVDQVFASAPNTVAGVKTACRAILKVLLRVAVLYVRERIAAVR
jgi:hypothetical protein